jgi:hypothetical protein
MFSLLDVYSFKMNKLFAVTLTLHPARMCFQALRLLSESFNMHERDVIKRLCILEEPYLRLLVYNCASKCKVRERSMTLLRHVRTHLLCFLCTTCLNLMDYGKTRIRLSVRCVSKRNERKR